MTIRETDNRDLAELVVFLEARIEALVRRVRELEAEREDWREHHAESLEAIR